ncbi:hypothetical protein ABW19_dt0210355 [Dactylella cylindrospora]|nr:hypothetical protein ABW19_dt0210355 [Dactylella cylindrospora]
MILDFQNNTLLVHLCAKETLASRWQVKIVLLSSIFGLLVLGILVRSIAIGRISLDPDPVCEGRCFSVFWWGTISNCGERVPPTWWVYFAYRIISFVAILLYAEYNTDWYHYFEQDLKAKVDKAKLQNLQKKWAETLEIADLSENEQEDIKYWIENVEREYREKRKRTKTPIFDDYHGVRWEGLLLLLDNNIISIATFTTVVGIANSGDIVQSSGIDSVGQIIALVVAIASTITALVKATIITRDGSRNKNTWYEFKKSISIAREYEEYPTSDPDSDSDSNDSNEPRPTYELNESSSSSKEAKTLS